MAVFEAPITKLLSVKSLREEYAGLLEQKRKVCSAYKRAMLSGVWGYVINK
ncbi:hypothetical protein BRYFOR_06038 [Marvinbryantia formatexigens DSM 14469]|uniref:Uncharacterized protein n=1 Tax=Marvinbryantia formatexigens DSM 14469 TaxID=478749 RepID=C6LBP3_9FIRM|nr:hypothetical protein BRYFOR_06038 [Marvinbryantia formatexigens DSM 14469]